MSDPENCPHCGVSLVGEQISEAYRELYADTKFRRTIGHVVPGAFDGVLFWSCPDCEGRWHRWPEGDFRHSRAEKYINP